MPSLDLGSDITLHFTDSGPPLNGDSTYTTIFVFHTHTFHSGIFQRLADLAETRGLRIIAFNRRQYPGSTPYTEAERRVILGGSLEERTVFMKEEGFIYALAIDRLIQDLNLPQQVAVAGWSLGVTFAFAVDIAARLKINIKSFIMLEPTIWPLGIPEPPDAYLPLWDKSLPVEQRTPAFGKWYSSFFKHGDLSSRDIGQLEKRSHDASKPITTDAMSHMELLSTTDLSTDLRFDTAFVGDFSSALAAQTDLFLTDLEVRKAWGNPKALCLYGGATFWATIYTVWYLEERGKMLQYNDISFKAMEGANHFFVWERPEETLNNLKELTNL